MRGRWQGGGCGGLPPQFAAALRSPQTTTAPVKVMAATIHQKLAKSATPAQAASRKPRGPSRSDAHTPTHSRMLKKSEKPAVT